MKKLVHETTDELTRSLLIAGIEHRPPAGNKAQLLVALGAGSAVGLFSAKAFGWFGTGAGKVTMVSMALGVAGAVYGVAPLLQAGDPARDTSDVALDERSEPARTTAVAAPLMPPAPLPVKAPELLPEASDPALPSASTSTLDARGSGEPVPAGAAKPRLTSRKTRARAARAEQDPGPLPAVEKTPPAVGALAEAEQAPEAEKSRERLHLAREVKLVDEMHWAARQRDHEALARFVEAYRLQFPDGQLQAEVAKFAARLERSSSR